VTAAVDWRVRHDADGIVARHRGGVVHVELARPDRLNAFDGAMTRSLAEAVLPLGDDPAVRAVLLSGQGRAFSAGADVRAAADPVARASVADELRRWTTPLVLALRSMPQPVVAAVQGAAVGAGCALALACDHVVAAPSASFRLAFAQVGLAPDTGASVTAVARAGYSLATTMMLFGEPRDGADAVAAGLADRLAPEDDLLRTAEELVGRLAAGPRGSFAAIKRLHHETTYAGLEHALGLEADLQEDLLTSADFAEALTAFGERRAPRFAD
jgi:enoyl-CoA hydratase/carnithine racemase